MSALPDPRLHSAAAERNRGPLLDTLRAVLPASRPLRALEIASGSGQHAAYMAAHQPDWQWWPSEADAQALASIVAWCRDLPNVQPPLRLDVVAAPWAGVPDGLDLVFCANLLHIASWACCAALMQGAARHLRPGGLLVTYGPYVVPGQATAPSNLAFDADLRARNPAWGLRDVAQVTREAAAAGLSLVGQHLLPAHNRVLVFNRAGQ